MSKWFSLVQKDDSRVKVFTLSIIWCRFYTPKTHTHHICTTQDSFTTSQIIKTTLSFLRQTAHNFQSGSSEPKMGHEIMRQFHILQNTSDRLCDTFIEVSHNFYLFTSMPFSPTSPYDAKLCSTSQTLMPILSSFK